MSNQKFTPGPWVFNQGDEWEEPSISMGSHIETPQLYNPWHFILLDGFEEGCSEAQANAHLIAASPDMYEMIRQMSDSLEDLGVTDLAGAGRKLLAKARGER